MRVLSQVSTFLGGVGVGLGGWRCGRAQKSAIIPARIIADTNGYQPPALSTSRPSNTYRASASAGRSPTKEPQRYARARPPSAPSSTLDEQTIITVVTPRAERTPLPNTANCPPPAPKPAERLLAIPQPHRTRRLPPLPRLHRRQSVIPPSLTSRYNYRPHQNLTVAESSRPLQTKFTTTILYSLNRYNGRLARFIRNVYSPIICIKYRYTTLPIRITYITFYKLP